MFDIIKEIVYEVTGKTSITYDTDFVQDLELNSFDIMNIICAFEDRFDVSIPTREVWHLRQVKDVMEYMKEKGYVQP
ncbi:MAG: acyl carrier protein [Clostridia bacterium]|nr:acyl carrier protein [Clostridia bacterium]NCC42899.1 acyl carrier protein [Clostridia bacterium]